MLAASGTSQAQERLPFSMPWNDGEPGPTDLRWMGPSGPLPLVRAGDDGHLYAGGKRIRFWGINCTFDTCVPTHGEAEAAAARLSKFGINAVRFHHVDSPWARTLIDYRHPDGSSRHFNAEALDRFDYFVAQLEARGIYVDLNLHVSRSYTEADGITGFGPFDADVMQLQKVLAIFNQDAQALDREYATQLLLHENPYTHQVYAKDPGVAVVEVLNEAGLVSAYLGGDLDALPERYQGELRDLWNRWLTSEKHYRTTDALLAAWQAAKYPPSELLRDREFEQLAQGAGPWVVQVEPNAAASTAVSSDADGTHDAVVITTTATAESWKVQIYQAGLFLEEGVPYTLSFRARGEAGKTFEFAVAQQGGNYESFSPYAHGQLGGDWVEYRTSFIADQRAAEVGEVRWQVHGLAGGLGTIEIAQPSLTRGMPALLPGQRLEDGTIPILSLATGRTTRATLDWLSFLRAKENAYYAGMRRFLREELGCSSLIVGTAGTNSPPSVQEGFDVVDTHYYWDPQVTSGSSWTAARMALVHSPPRMVEDIAGTSITRKPQFVTEYNHSEPNPFAGDAPLAVAAYGSFQDWDGIFLFDYGPIAGDAVSTPLAIGANPRKMANLLIGALMFRGFGVAPARRELSVAYDARVELDKLLHPGEPWKVAHAAHVGVDLRQALIHRLRLSTEPGATTSPFANLEDVHRFESDTGELVWDTSEQATGHEFITINAPKTRAVIGFGQQHSFALEDVTIAPGSTSTGWSTIAISLVEGESFSAKGRAIVVATADQQNTDQHWTDDTPPSVDDWGHGPTLIEVVPATIVLQRPANEVRVWALGPQGQRALPLAVDGDDHHAEFTLGSSIPTLWYEVELGAVSQHPPGNDQLSRSCEAFCASLDPHALPCATSGLDCQAWCVEEHARALSAACGCVEEFGLALTCSTENASGACQGSSRFDSTGPCAESVRTLEICRGSSPPCSSWTRELIDDLEDGDGDIQATAGRRGAWRWSLSPDSTGQPSPPLPSPGGAGGSARSLQVVGTHSLSLDGWAHLDVPLDDHSPYDASAYGGVSLYARGQGELSLQIASQELWEAQAYGKFHERTLELRDEWTYYEVPFSGENAISQPSWVQQPIPLDTSALIVLQFQPSKGPFEFAIDDLAFLRAPPPGAGGGPHGSPAYSLPPWGLGGCDLAPRCGPAAPRVWLPVLGLLTLASRRRRRRRVA